MKKTEFLEELRSKSVEELNVLERELRDELFRLRMKHYSGQVQKGSDLRQKRRDIARVQTIRAEKQEG